MLNEIDPTLLKQVLFYLIGPGAGLVAYWLMERFVPETWTAEHKRYTSLAVAALLAMAAYGASVALSYLPKPETVQGWIEMLFAVGGVAVGISQGIHGRLQLRKASIG